MMRTRRALRGDDPRNELMTSHFIDPARQFCQVCQLPAETIFALHLIECPGRIPPVRRARFNHRARLGRP
jgi:hypothetical protein